MQVEHPLLQSVVALAVNLQRLRTSQPTSVVDLVHSASHHTSSIQLGSRLGTCTDETGALVFRRAVGGRLWSLWHPGLFFAQCGRVRAMVLKVSSAGLTRPVGT